MISYCGVRLWLSEVDINQFVNVNFLNIFVASLHLSQCQFWNVIRIYQLPGIMENTSEQKI